MILATVQINKPLRSKHVVYLAIISGKASHTFL